MGLAQARPNKIIVCFSLYGYLQSVPRVRTKAQVFLWGGGASVPQVLSHPPESVITAVAIGRSQRVGLTEDGKLLLWEVCVGTRIPLGTSWYCTSPSLPPSLPLSPSHHPFLPASTPVVVRVPQHHSVHHESVTATRQHQGQASTDIPSQTC